MSAKWIFYPRDFELYHLILLNSRREEIAADHLPCMWRMTRPEYACNFKKTVDFPERTTVTPLTHGRGYIRVDNGAILPLNQPHVYEAGRHTIVCSVDAPDGFPDLYIDSPYLKTDEGFLVSRMDADFLPAACEPAFTSPSDDPRVFPFSYSPLSPVSVEEIPGGRLYDFGRESFGPVTVSGDGVHPVTLVYGESREEALSFDDAIVREVIAPFTGESVRPARAFRFLTVKSVAFVPEVRAALEYLPIEDRASFCADDPLVEKIFSVCSHTFHLNSREFYLDGIKRDRWVWSGDAYQSFLVNRYLYADPAITKRTIRALLGRPPYVQHINTINDYSDYLILSVLDYYRETGDEVFVREIAPDLLELYRFILGRLENGYTVARKGDWIFIDWGTIDKNGTLAAEQILLWQTHRAMAEIAKVAGLSGKEFDQDTDALRERILRDFFDKEKFAFRDNDRADCTHITRHAAIYAILFDFFDEAAQKKLAASVLENDEIDAITTPYFKFFELLALGKLGKIETVQKFIAEYWGGMLALGATSVWEQFDAKKTGIEHYGMYGKKFDCSLCHAWGSGPIALLGKFCAGVSSTSVGGATFEVRPNPGIYRAFDACVPMREGNVKVSLRGGRVSVTASVDGGTLIYRGMSFPLEKDKEITV